MGHVTWTLLTLGTAAPCCLEGAQGPPGDPGLPGSPGAPGLPGSRGRDGVCNPDIKKSAFTVIKTSSQTGNIGDVVTFQEKYTDVNDEFNTGTNKFVCTFPGTYFFTFSIAVHTINTEISEPVISLVHENRRVVSAHARTGPAIPGDFDQATTSAVLNLAPGDEVWLSFEWKNGLTVFSDQYNYSSLSGHLLYTNEE